MPCGEQDASEDGPPVLELFHMDQMEEKEEKEEEEPANFIYISRHGESNNNVCGKIGGNADLSPRGQQYAKALGTFVNNLKLPDLQVWISEYKRTSQTASHIRAPKIVRTEINEINAGLHNELTYEDIAEIYPIEFAMRDRDKLGYRYPDGESYMDVLDRLQPILKEISVKRSSDNILIVSHQATIRCLVAHLLGTPLEEVPYTKVPLHTIMKLSTNPNLQYNHPPQYYRLPVDCVDTFRPRPDNCDNDRTKEDAIGTVPFHM